MRTDRATQLRAERGAVLNQMERLASARGTAADFLAGQFFRSFLGDAQATRWCSDNGVPMLKANNEGVNSAGGVLVPDTVVDDVLLLLEAYGVAHRECRVWQMLSDSAPVPRATSGFSFSWIAEGAAVPESQSGYDALDLVAKKTGCLVKISNELWDDARAAFGRYIIEGTALGLAKVQDDALFNGDGTSAYAGIQGIGPRLLDGSHNAGKVTAAAHSTYATLDGADVAALLAPLPARAMPGAKIYVSVTGYAALVRIAGTSGGLVASVGPDGEISANYLGRPIVFVPSLPSSTGSLSGKLMMVAGNMRMGVALGERRDVTIRKLVQRFADTDQTGLRVTARIDIVPHDLGDNTTAGAITGLFGA